MKPLIRPDRVRELVQLQYASLIEEAYGEHGVDRLLELATALDAVHTQIAFELRDGITVCIALDANSRLLTPAVEVPLTQLSTVVDARATLQVLEDDRVLVAAEITDPLDLADRAIVYHYNGHDCFVIDGELREVLNITTLKSIFGTPMFTDLEDALEHYSTHMALHSQCPVLENEAWYDPNRLVLRNRPEATLQKSLYHYLRASLRGADGIETRREQILDEKWRTDVKVTWALHKRISYVEVKWMGKSVNRDGTRLSGFQPGDGDAVDGASQLAEYLDVSRRDAPAFDHHGLLAVFDARRNGLDSISISTVSRTDGLYYRNRDVAYDPDLSDTRHDFASPQRFFMEPINLT